MDALPCAEQKKSFIVVLLYNEDELRSCIINVWPKLFPPQISMTALCRFMAMPSLFEGTVLRTGLHFSMQYLACRKIDHGDTIGASRMPSLEAVASGRWRIEYLKYC